MARLDQGEVRIQQIVALESSDAQLVGALGGDMELIVNATLLRAKEVCAEDRDAAMPVPEGVDGMDDCQMEAKVGEANVDGAISVVYACSGRVCAYAGVCLGAAEDLVSAFEQTREGKEFGLPRLIQASQPESIA